MLRKSVIFILILIAAQSCFYKKAVIQNSGVFDCFEEGKLKPDGTPFTCEPSAIIFNKSKVWIANDKLMPEHNHIFSFSLKDFIANKNIIYTDNKVLDYGRKYEAFTITPNNQFIIAAGAFDTNEKDSIGAYNNTIVYWNTNNSDDIKILGFEYEHTAQHSIEIKELLRKTLVNEEFPNGPPYLKVEGLAAIPGNKLLFGIREYGNKYDDFHYSIILLTVSYESNNKSIRLKNDFQKIYQFSPSAELGIRLPIAVSSIEYNKFDNRIYMITSYELDSKDSEIGAYLWSLSLKDLKSNQKPTLLRDKSGKGFHFTNKVEGLTILDKNTLLLIADDDRVLGSEQITDFENQFIKRKFNQGYWFIVNLFY